MRTLMMAIWMLVAAVELPADTITTLVASASGWYNSGGGPQPPPSSFAAGWEGVYGEYYEDTEFRSFVVFNLAGLSGVIDSASLSLYVTGDVPGQKVSGYDSQDSTETLGIFDVSTPIADLENGAADFGDLGTGTLFGSTAVSAADAGTRITIPFNADGLAALNAGQNDIAFGGAITTLAKVFDCSRTDPSCNELISGLGVRSDFPPYLIVGSKVPEPESVYLFLTVLAGVTVIRFRQAHRPR